MGWRSGLPAFLVGGGLVAVALFGANVPAAGAPDLEVVQPGPTVQPRLIYGTDDRLDVYEVTDPRQLALAGSVCSIISASNLTDNGDGTTTIRVFAYTRSGLPACEGERFGSQPVSPTCSAFLVGENLVATAGHCISTTDMMTKRFVFGFRMQDATTPVVVVPTADVYTPAAVVARQNTSVDDYSVVRLTRPVTTPGAIPLELRRSGSIANGTRVGMMGHPAGLPLKIAYGDRTKVYGTSAAEYITLNTDSYGGNSGSPIFNQTTGLVEGILVRGATDYVLQASCFRSVQRADAEADEDATRIGRILQWVPRVPAGVGFGKPIQNCGELVTLLVRDSNSTDTSVEVLVTTDSGDVEIFTLSGPDADKVYTANVPLATGAAQGGNGTIEAQSTITLTYNDPNNDFGVARTYTRTTIVDCEPPTLRNIRVRATSPETATVTLEADEPVSGFVRYGTRCDSLNLAVPFDNEGEFTVLLRDLAPGTLHNLRVEAKDSAGNTILYPGDGCYTFRTSSWGQPLFRDPFDPTPTLNWTRQNAVGPDLFTVATYAQAHTAPNVYAFAPSTQSSREAALISPPFTETGLLRFRHTFQFEQGWDGAAIQISTDDGATWSDLGPHALAGGYTGVVQAGSGTTLAGRPAWTGGTLGTMDTAVFDLSAFPGSKRVAFRVACDSSVSSPGWRIDTVELLALETEPPANSVDQWQLR